MFWFGKKIRYAIRSPKWQEVRKQHLKNNSTCAGCGRKDSLEVHHIEPVHINPDRELDPENLITLCDKYCHFALGHLMDYKSWNKDIYLDSQVYFNKVKKRPYK